MVLDIDASLHRDPLGEQGAGTGPNYKGGFGFHPIYCFADATGETLAVRLRPGNAGANNVADHVAVLDAAIAQLPDRDRRRPPRRRRPRPGAPRPSQVRVDSAGCTDFVWRCRARNVGFAVVARSNAARSTPPSAGSPCDRTTSGSRRVRQDGDERARAPRWPKLTELVDLSDWPDRHPADRAPRTAAPRRPAEPVPLRDVPLLGSLHRPAAGDPVELDVHMRAHAHVEDHIRRLKDSGATRFPFVDFDANRRLARRRLHRRPPSCAGSSCSA